jgi:putative transposase
MTSDSANIRQSEWPYGPIHVFTPGTFYIVTAATHQKEKFFHSPPRLTLAVSTLFEQAERFGWRLQAWAVMPNHYHFVAQAPKDPRSLKPMIQAIHSLTTQAVNAEDGTPDRRVWSQHYDSCVTNEKGYLARLHYVHANPVKHGVVPVAEDYPWCSMNWFLRKAESAFCRTVLTFRFEGIYMEDDF